MLKKKYSFITFPLSSQGPEEVLNAYLKELNIKKLDSYENIKLVFLHGLRDYLDGKLEQNAFASLCTDICYSRSEKDFWAVMKKYPGKLRQYIDDGADINWLNNSEYFEPFKKELREFLKEALQSSDISTPQQLLTIGLQKGFGGKTDFQKTERSGFEITTSNYEIPATGAIYHDEWAADRAGGGQELVRVGEQQFTRVYAGGTVSLAALAVVGITKADVTTFLMKMITQLGDKTRLEADCPPIQDGDWQYEYTVKEQLPEIPLTTGKEVISYKGEVVFVHWFLMCPVE